MAQAVETDLIPLIPELGEEFHESSTFRKVLIPAWFHFFTIGRPEIIPFGNQYSRAVHGGLAVPLYYKDQLRSSWYGLEPGMHINKDPRDQINDFDSLFIIIDGEIQTRIDGKEMILKKGQAIFVPAGMKHEFWCVSCSGQFILLMFGESA